LTMRSLLPVLPPKAREVLIIVHTAGRAPRACT
jgi:hypothetical protein